MIRFRLFLLACFAPACLLADDSIPNRITKNEIGINATLLLKQVINFSNSSFVMQPYALTYKRIMNNYALRFGLGINLNREEAMSGALIGPGVNLPAIPVYNRATVLDFRAGIERRLPIERRMLVYFGLDMVASTFKEESLSVVINDNLPTYYTYSKSSLTTTNYQFGGGPVVGFQWMISKRIGLFTETPVYFLYNKSKEQTNDLFINNFGGGEIIDENSETNESSGMNISVTLPVTLYLSFRF